MHRDLHRPKRCSCEPTKDVRAVLVKFPSFLAESPRNFMDNASCIRIPDDPELEYTNFWTHNRGDYLTDKGSLTFSGVLSWDHT